VLESNESREAAALQDQTLWGSSRRRWLRRSRAASRIPTDRVRSPLLHGETTATADAGDGVNSAPATLPEQLMDMTVGAEVVDRVDAVLRSQRRSATRPVAQPLAMRSASPGTMCFGGETLEDDAFASCSRPKAGSRLIPTSTARACRAGRARRRDLGLGWSGASRRNQLHLLHLLHEMDR
jgi:hypothetical protein